MIDGFYKIIIDHFENGFHGLSLAFLLNAVFQGAEICTLSFRGRMGFSIA
jgi:hypothetical protein